MVLDASFDPRSRLPRFVTWVRLVALAIALTLLPTAASGQRASGEAAERLELHSQLDTVQQLIDRGEPADALELLDSLGKNRGKRQKPTPRESMLRGTARIMLGEIKQGADLLEKSLKADPTLREGWLNLGGLEVAEGNYRAALAAFQKAHDLAPGRPDGHLNLGAVLVLLERRVEAKEHFDRYLELRGGSAEAQFLVATNYALAGLEHLALEHLAAAVRLDEKMRLRARQDHRFQALDSMEYRLLLLTDDYQPPSDHRTHAAAFRSRWNQREPELLYALLDALAEQGMPYRGEVESNPRWALVWADRDVRIKIYNQDNGTGVIRMSAPESNFTADEWQKTCHELLREVHRRLGE